MKKTPSCNSRQRVAAEFTSSLRFSAEPLGLSSAVSIPTVRNNRIYEAGVGVKTQFRPDAERRKFEFG
jgi:hypothetical protein